MTRVLGVPAVIEEVHAVVRMLTAVDHLRVIARRLTDGAPLEERIDP
jgi:hypothetical protein